MVAASAYLIGFRLIHIIVGTIWVGGVALLVLFVQPSAASLGPSAGPFVQEMMLKRRLPVFLLGAGAVTIGAGLFLYWHDWQAVGSLGDWVSTRYGLVLTIGGGLAITAWLVGLFGLKPTQDRMMRLAGELAALPPPPPPERLAEVQALQLRARRLSVGTFAILVVAVLAMATAQYW
ncbi:MAG TPA: hypothetical protein VKA30_09915 [Actinomycetota bacterium]|nr:hypothetical protein [Actinomycetota bacterium]